MPHAPVHQLVFTIKDRCRVCYTCVRECPVKAIKINNGQAEVINERCIGCGNCIKVCSQGAKVFLNSTGELIELLASHDKVAACIATSFPAEFSEIEDYHIFIGMLKKLGFNFILETGFGADLVALEYKKILEDESSKPIISSDCPSIVFFIEQYHPELTTSLAKIVSPMVAMSRITKKKYGENCKVVFIGPCIAKKVESNEIDVVLTFKEIRRLFEQYNITPENTEPSDFDPPFAGKGSIFPVNHGLLQTIPLKDEIKENDIIIAEGHINFREAVLEFENGLLNSQHLELLCCDGCILGPGMTDQGKRYLKSKLVGNYVKNKLENLDEKQWEKDIDDFSEIDMTQEFEIKDRRIKLPSKEEIDKVLISIGKFEYADYLNCGACGYNTCEEHAIAIVQGFAENEMCLPYSIEKLHKSVKELNISNDKLASARQALKQSEKLASMGQLSAGIAHELNNPLGIISMYSNILKEESSPESQVYQDLELIAEQAERCKKIVGGLLNFARKNQVSVSNVNIEQFILLSIESIIVPENIRINIKAKLQNPIVQIDPDQMMQVLVNIEKNAIEAMPEGGDLLITLYEEKNDFVINLQDTGTGISEENMDKIFTPFFTTKPIGKGTGLGLPIIYGIIKMHKGRIDVKSNNNPEKGVTGTTFTITIPRTRPD